MHLGKNFAYFICKLLLFRITIFVYLTEYLLYFTGVVLDRMCFGLLRLFCAFNTFLHVSRSMLCITQNSFRITIFVYLTEYLLYFTGVVLDRMCFGLLRLFCAFNTFLHVSGSMLCITQNFLCISHIILCVSKRNLPATVGFSS